jgi:hypothetical protein
VLALKPFCAFDAVELAQSREVLRSFGALVLCQMLGRAEVSDDLVEISRDKLAIYVDLAVHRQEHASSSGGSLCVWTSAGCP